MAKHASAPEPDFEPSDLEDLIGYNLKRAYIIVQKDFREALGEDGLSARVFSALSLAVKYPRITQSELARMMGIERSGLVAIVDELEERNYLHRAPVPGDRRVQALILTDDGRRAYDAAIEVVRAHEERLFQNIPQEEIAALLATLRKIRREEIT